MLICLIVIKFSQWPSADFMCKSILRRVSQSNKMKQLEVLHDDGFFQICTFGFSKLKSIRANL